MIRLSAVAAVVLLASFAPTAAPPAIDHRLYVTNKTGISVYDIDRGHAFIRKIDIPESGDYPGIAASPQLEHLYVTSHTRDEVICLDLATDAVVWRKNLGKYADSLWVTPDGKRLYVPFRDEADWKSAGQYCPPHTNLPMREGESFNSGATKGL